MALPWFKFYGGEYLSDPKIFGLSACQRSCWTTLLCLASMSSTPGQIEYLSEEQLMLMSGIDFMREEWENTKGTLSTLASRGMVEIKDEKIIICNFQKRQASYLTEAEKKAKYREKQDQKGTMSPTNRIDKSREDKIYKTAPIKNREEPRPNSKPEPISESLKEVREKWGKKK